jgi:hypothetical protein
LGTGRKSAGNLVDRLRTGLAGMAFPQAERPRAAKLKTTWRLEKFIAWSTQFR